MQSDMAGSVAANDDQALPPLPSPERIQELLFDACRIGRVNMILVLLQAGADIGGLDAKGHTPLILAAYHGQQYTVATLLAFGAPLDQGDVSKGNTALMGVAFKGHAAIADQLLDAGADPDSRNHAGQTALMLAALFGHTAIVDMLIAAGANPMAKDVAGNCAVSLARAQSNEVMVARLLKARTAI